MYITSICIGLANKFVRFFCRVIVHNISALPFLTWSCNSTVWMFCFVNICFMCVAYLWKWTRKPCIIIIFFVLFQKRQPSGGGLKKDMLCIREWCCNRMRTSKEVYQMNINDAPCSAFPTESYSKDVKTILDGNPSQTLRKIAIALNIPVQTRKTIFTNWNMFPVSMLGCCINWPRRI